MHALPHTDSCFVCGESNASGLRLRFETDGQTVFAHFIARPDHIGFKGTIHGGIIATVLDEIMVWACAVKTRRFGYCAELTVRFASPMRPGSEVFVTSELVHDRRGRLFEAKADLRDAEGLLLASATGKYLPIKESELPELLSDFKEDASRWFNPLAGERGSVITSR
jgi:acyl-coenzyme A thioesterase PaaI-like protein